MKLWIDDVRTPPPGYIWIRSVDEAKRYINTYSSSVDFDNIVVDEIELIDIDHDAGVYKSRGGDYIKLLDWLEETGKRYPIRLHSMNPVGVQNMRTIIQKNGWKEIFI